MKKTVLVFVVALLCAVSHAEDYERYANKESVSQIRREVRTGGLPALAARADETLDAALKLAVVKLREKDAGALASRIESEWNTTYKGMLTFRVGLYGDIGDHAPLIQWIEDIYDALEKALTLEFCLASHLADIKSLNLCIPIVFSPQTFPLDGVKTPRKYEYRAHFAKGLVYYGLFPVVVYWAVNAGSGNPFIAMASEWFAGNVVGPPLSDWIFNQTTNERR